MHSALPTSAAAPRDARAASKRETMENEPARALAAARSPAAAESAAALARGGRDELSARDPEALAAAAAALVASPWPFEFSLLAAGQRYRGAQSVSARFARPSESWRVLVSIDGVDAVRATLCGVMEACDAPRAPKSVLTYWDGEVVDGVRHFFLTRRAAPNWDEDLAYWSRLPGFAEVARRLLLAGPAAAAADAAHALPRFLARESRYVFMRWKERCFLNTGPECGLTIAGFYYVAADRQTGSIVAVYCDPDAAPFQRLRLRPCLAGALGHALAQGELA